VAEKEKPLGMNHPKVIWSRLKIKWPLLVWVLAVVAVVLLLEHSGNEGSMAGVVERVAEEVAPTATSRIESIMVTTGQRVQAGQPVAKLSSLHVDVAIAEATAGINTEVMQAELDNSRVSTQYDRLIFELESEISLTELRLEAEQVEVDVLDSEIANLQKLVDDNLIELSQVVPLRAQREAKARAVALYPKTITALNERLAEAKRLKTESAVGLDLEAYRENLTSGSQLGALGLEKESLTLTASRSGIVTEIAREQGEVVGEGQTILTIVDDQPTRVIGLLGESRARDLEVGEKYVVHGDYNPEQLYEATLIQVMPEISALTRGQILMPTRTIRGRMVYFEVRGEHGLLAGESVTLRTDRSVLMKIKDRIAGRSTGESTELSRK